MMPAAMPLPDAPRGWMRSVHAAFPSAGCTVAKALMVAEALLTLKIALAARAHGVAIV